MQKNQYPAFPGKKKIIPMLTAVQEMEFQALFSWMGTADSYKYSHPEQFMDEIRGMFDYFENRGGEVDWVYFTGLRYYIVKYLGNRITKFQVEMFEKMAEAHGIPFEYELFMEVVNRFQGFAPVEIRSVPENELYPVQVPLFTVESISDLFSDEKVWSLVGFLETLLMKVWYPSAVATKSYYVKESLKTYFEKTSMAPDEAILFAYHNFGARSSTVHEQALVGGMAQAQVFRGTDNFASLKMLELFYGEDMSQYKSIPATEHSTTTSAGREMELEFVNRFVKKQVSRGNKLFAAVMDSYDIFSLVKKVVAKDSEVRTMLEENQAKLVLRPDSGDFFEILTFISEALKESEAVYKNGKGYLTSDIFSVIWGDGVNPKTIEGMAEHWVGLGMSMDILAFGSGGDLMQNVGRDDYKTAIKCSSVTLEDGSKRDVFKDPITDPGKTSKKGEVTTVKNKVTGEIYAVPNRNKLQPDEVDLMEVVYRGA